MAASLCAVSIDLDPLSCYADIHGLGELSPSLKHVILRRAVPRLAELLARHDIRATWFVVGSDLADDAEGREILGNLARAGHELANHSYSHDYRMARQSHEAVRDEIARAHEVIAQVAGTPPVGFRAPGYDLTPQVVEALGRQGYLYDSSLLSAPLYWTAKLAIMGAMAAVGRPSRAVVTDAKGLLAPIDPYRLDEQAFWRRGTGPLVELPVAVTSHARLWVIGTSVILAPSWFRRRLLSGMNGRPLINFELHGIDLIDGVQDEIPAALIARQPDLQRPLAQKQQALDEALSFFGQEGPFVTLREAAEKLGI